MGKFGYTVERMNIYCHKGRDKDVSLLLQSITLNINIDSDDFTCFSGHTPEEVEKAHKSHKSLFSFNLLSRIKKRTMNLNPFNQTCIGLETADEYQVSLNLIRLDLLKLALLAGGAFLFFFASSLSNNDAFFYLTGILSGNFLSILVLVWFISKLFPRKPLMYGVLASGWTLVAYLGQVIYENIQLILISYQKYVAMYCLAASIISFAVCYYKGPPKSERSRNLIKWGLQLAGLVSIFFSSEFREATVGIIVGSIALYFFPLGVFDGVRRFWRRRFPPKRRLLSKEEFEEQGRVETEKALKELREYVKSPKCKEQWKLVMNLSQPTRFASFVEGDQHLTLDETIAYDETEFSDDDDDSSDYIEESLQVDENFQRIDKSKLPMLQNGSKRFQSFNTPAKVTSSTPNGGLRTRQQNGSRRAQNTTYDARDGSRRAQNTTFEISDDE